MHFVAYSLSGYIWNVWAVVVAQLVEWLPKPEVCSLNPSSHRQFYLPSTVLNKLCRKDENKEKRSWEWPIKNIWSVIWDAA